MSWWRGDGLGVSHRRLFSPRPWEGEAPDWDLASTLPSPFRWTNAEAAWRKQPSNSMAEASTHRNNLRWIRAHPGYRVVPWMSCAPRSPMALASRQTATSGGRRRAIRKRKTKDTGRRRRKRKKKKRLGDPDAPPPSYFPPSQANRFASA